MRVGRVALHFDAAERAPAVGDLGHTRLRLQIDLEAGEAILVDLSMRGRDMGAHVVVPGGAWQAPTASSSRAFRRAACSLSCMQAAAQRTS